MNWKGPTNFKVGPKEVSSFICLFLLWGECSHSLCQALGLSWPSAEPKQFFDLRVLPQTFSAGLSSSLLGHIFQSQCVCSISPACLIQQLPDLQQGIPAALAVVAWLLLWCQCQNWSNPSLWFPASAAALQSRHSWMCSHRSNRIRGWVHRWQGCTKQPPWAAGRTQSWFNPAQGDTAGCETTAHSSSLTSDIKAFSPGVGSEGSGNSLNLSWEHCPPSDPQPRPQKGNPGHL